MSQIVLSGKLEFLELSDLFQLIGNNGGAGVLTLKSPHVTTLARVYFENGNPVNAVCGARTGLSAILSLFGWGEGSFEFSAGSVPVERVIKQNRMEIILEGLRMLDDGKIDKVGSKADPSAKQAPAVSGIPVLKGPLVDYLYIADEETFQDGDKILEEGRHGSWMWVILEGIVDIVKSTPHGPMVIGSVSEGNFLGDISTFLAKEHVRGASAVARGRVQLGVVDSQRLSNEFSTLSRDFRDLLLSFDKRLKQVSANCMRVRMGHPLLTELQQDISPFSFEQGEVDTVWMLKKGSAIVSRTMGGMNVVLAELGPGDSIGRIPYLNTGMEPFGAVVSVSRDIELAPIDPARFLGEYNLLSGTFKNIIEHISSSIAVTIQTAEYFFTEASKR